MQREERLLTGQPTERPTLVQPSDDGDAQSLYMPVKDAATLLGVSTDHVIRAVRNGVVPGFKWSDTYRVLRAFVDALHGEVLAGGVVVVEEFAKTWAAKPEAVA